MIVKQNRQYFKQFSTANSSKWLCWF